MNSQNPTFRTSETIYLFRTLYLKCLSSPVLLITDYFQEHTLALSGRCRSCKKAFDSDSGFYHNGAGECSCGSRVGNRVTVINDRHQSKTRYSSVCSRCSEQSGSDKDSTSAESVIVVSSSSDRQVVKKVSQGTETEISTLRRLKKQKKPPRRSIPAANPVDEAGSASPTTAERRSRDGTKLIRRHSRASSVDRREIFQKYIQNSNENADEIRPYEDHDPELKAEQAPTDVEDESPEFNLMKSPSMKKEFRLDPPSLPLRRRRHRRGSSFADEIRSRLFQGRRRRR